MAPLIQIRPALKTKDTALQSPVMHRITSAKVEIQLFTDKVLMGQDDGLIKQQHDEYYHEVKGILTCSGLVLMHRVDKNSLS